MTDIVVCQAELNWSQIDRVLFVGGSSRMPMITAMLRELIGRDPDRLVSPDETVAHGIALYAQLMRKKLVPTSEPPKF